MKYRCLEKKGLRNVEIAFIRQCLGVDSESFCDCKSVCEYTCMYTFSIFFQKQNELFFSVSCTSDFEELENRRIEVSDYLKKHLGNILPKILRNVFFENPSDPIEYIGRYLLHHRVNSSFRDVLILFLKVF